MRSQVSSDFPSCSFSCSRLRELPVARFPTPQAQQFNVLAAQEVRYAWQDPFCQDNLHAILAVFKHSLVEES
jgi:hypothetical protein